MEEVQGEVILAANRLYQRYLEEDMAAGKYPPYKAGGMAYIRFAKEERELFRLLFMRDRSREAVDTEAEREALSPILEIIRKNTGLSEEEAYLFHIEMWIYVHGIGTMLATEYLKWDEEFISKVITDAYMGLKYRYSRKEDDDGSN